jgi:hypothetical protein
MKNDGGYDSRRERGRRGNYSWVLIQTTFFKLLSLFVTFYFLIECMRGQSLNSCKRVGVRSHIPNLLGTWGLSTICMGKSVSQERQAKERKFVWVEGEVFS